MADISKELAAILSAIYGEDVRGSIHDAIDLINKVSETVVTIGTDVDDPTSSIIGYYKDSVYINNTTWDVWKCDGASWILQGNIIGNGITNIALTATVGLIDTYTITYKDGTTTDFDVTNGRGIVNITKTSSGLKDTYTILYSDASTSTFEVDNGRGITSISKTSTAANVDTYTITYSDGTTTTYDITNGINGTNGNKWYRGTDINGKATNPTVFATSGIAYAYADDYYLNPSEGAIYYCVLEGDPSTALWVFDFTLAGGGAGVSTWGDLLNKPFQYVGSGGLEIVGSTPADYTLQVKVDGSYIQTDSNGALTINPNVLKGVYKYDPVDFRTDDTNKIVYLSQAIHNQLSKLNPDGTVPESALDPKVTAKLSEKFSGVVSGDTITFTNATFIGGTDDYVLDLYCSDLDRYIKTQSISGNTLTVTLDDVAASGTKAYCVALKV